ncbi:undecaprenyl/decaprenyl-phosphate alpha-N-acetylglucosaminyl 1-phosphate transferase [Enterococcus faecium]|nr:undecaprenyl/decaprenyl-phosphate alpha-N-acetylglucosaminyl 1-phosphate transferase [Enterococcus faecium]
MIASLIIYFVADIRIDSFTLPFIGYIQLGWLSFPVTIFWIFGITNAVNLIDGLDGLAAGISLIGLITIGIIGYFFPPCFYSVYSSCYFLSCSKYYRFFPYNFYPAKIYLGDTGASIPRVYDGRPFTTRAEERDFCFIDFFADRHGSAGNRHVFCYH